MRQVQPGQKRSVHEPCEGGNDDRRRDQYPGACDPQILHHDTDGARGQDRVVSDGQVDPGGNQGQQHAAANQAVDGGLL